MTKVKINGKVYTLIQTIYDPFHGCFYYFVDGEREPFCDLDNEIEVIRCQDKD